MCKAGLPEGNGGSNPSTCTKIMLIYKKDVIMAVSEALVLLGKGNINNVRTQLYHAITLLNQWEKDRPERKNAEQARSSQLYEQLKNQQSI